MLEYFAVLRVAASSAAEPVSRAAAATYESANGQMTVTSQVSGFPASQGTRERPSGRLPSDRLRPSGRVAGKTLEIVDFFTYIGSKIHSSGNSHMEVWQRIAVAHHCMNQLDKHIWRSHISLATKIG